MAGMRVKSHRNHFVNQPQNTGNHPWSNKFRPSPWTKPEPTKGTDATKPRPIIIAPPPPLFGVAPAVGKSEKQNPARKSAVGTAKRKTAAKPRKAATKRTARKASR